MRINDSQAGEGFPVLLLESLLDRLAVEVGPITKVDILDPDEHSNDRLEVLFRSGRKLVVKRGRHEWVYARFAGSRMAANLLNDAGQVIAPRHLDLPIRMEGEPVLAYWWIERPTLRELWDDIPEHQVPSVMRSWGRLIRKIHDVRPGGFGSLPDGERTDSELAGYLERDLAQRLLPAVHGEWVEGAWPVERLIELIPQVCARVGAREGVLVHNDLHMANILCDVNGDGVECVGLLDLEAAISGPPEADLASAEVLQGPCFFHHLPEDCMRWVREGYGDPLDPFVRSFFRIYHLANLGFYSALIGYHEHAAHVAKSAREETERLGTDLAE